MVDTESVIGSMQLREGDTLVVHADYFLDPTQRTLFREAVLRDCKIPGVGMIYIPSGFDVTKLPISGLTSTRIEAMAEVCKSAIKLLSPPYRRPSDDPNSEEDQTAEVDAWDALRSSLAKAGFSWEEMC